MLVVEIIEDILEATFIMTELADLRTQRSSTKGCITRIKNIIETKLSTLTYTELECRLGILESYFKQILSYQTSIEKLCPDDANEFKIRGELEDLYCATKSKILSTMAGNRASTSFQDNSLLSPSSFKNNLPKLKLPQFAGKYSDFHNFIGTFTKLVDSDHTLTPIEKFNHLLTCLSGAALRTIRAFEVSEANYPKALQQLKERYDNKYLTFQEHIVDLFNLPKVSRNSASQLRLLVDNTNAHLSALHSLGSSEDILNALIIHLINGKLDSESISKLEESVEHSKLPSWKDCEQVLNKRCQYLEARDTKPELRAESSSTSSIKQSALTRRKKGTPASTSLAVSKSSCAFCKGMDHSIHKCTKFLELPVLSRFEQVKNKALCINCLAKGHSVKKCSSSKCRVCSMPHHTLLHRYTTSASAIQSESSVDHTANNPAHQAQSSSTESSLTSSLMSNDKDHSQVFLASAVVEVKDNSGHYHLARALLDSASQLNFISESLAQTLRIPRSNSSLSISGIGNVSAEVRWSTKVEMKSRINEFTTELLCYILPRITGLQPERRVTTEDWDVPQNIQLADPQFYKPQKIDLLIGADVFFKLLSVGQIRLKDNLPTLQKTILGWVVSGRYSNPSPKSSALKCSVISEREGAEIINCEELSLNELVEIFWKEEGIDETSSKQSLEHMKCETIFRETTRRLADGRFMVKLPLRESSLHFPRSLDIARRRFYYLEKTLEKDIDLKIKYSEFLHDYLVADHMEEIKIDDLPEPHYFMPHRCVLRPDSSTTKVRVVFDASCRSASNKSLNDVLMVGPTIQDDLFLIISRFRCFRFALTADVSAMYRQILVYPEDRNLQLILWRDSPSSSWQVFRLKTVTYGTASAPFLATRCLRQLAEDFHLKTPKASKIVEKDFYMDDLLTGADSREELYELRQNIDTILKSGQLQLRKWYSNDLELLSEIPETEREKPLRINETDVIKALGIIWEPTSDEFHFHYKTTEKPLTKITKRTILSDVAKLFDPLGLINPVVVRAKIFLQELWLLKLNWDESIPQDLEYRWYQFKEQLHVLNNLKIPRLVLGSGKISNIALHGFADASVKAFGCCIYVRSTDECGNVFVNLVAAKSKVAPIRHCRSLPCLELCAALLLAKLFVKVRNNFPKLINDEVLWTDSEIVLDWLACHSSNWKPYVANRVSEIQRLTEKITWRHVNSKANPADIVSRGIGTEELSNSIWFSGPDFLQLTMNEWPPMKERHINMDDLPERTKKKSILICAVSESFLQVICSVSDFMKNCRRFAYVLRAVKRFKSKKSKDMNMGELSAAEIDDAFMHLIWSVQQQAFAKEIEALEKGKDIPRKSALQKLNPFLEEFSSIKLKLLRVGGRLKLAELPINHRFPILLPRSNAFVESYVRYLHHKNFHAGPQALVALIREKFWILNARDYARKIVRKCIHCFRYRPQLTQQIMGVLPKNRVSIALPFTHCGVDFCGPIQTTHRIRGKSPYKSYIAIFVCFVTRAVHIEVVSDLTSEAFIGALKRFVGRRNLCKHLYCDNATNFVGARRLLEEFRNAFFKEETRRDIVSWCSNNSIEFHHIPPRSPHFGGLWEAAVKSAKSHLFRTLQGSLLTFEELTTVMIQIEGVLNSRPITPLSTDPNDFQALTPAHFLNQAPLNNIVEPICEIEKINYLRRWQRVTALHQHFWQRWSKEYLHQLQQRCKWTSTSYNIKPGTMVLIHQEDSPSYKWKLGRVIDTIPGPDGNVRVVVIKTPNGTIQRAVQKVAPFPEDD